MRAYPFLKNLCFIGLAWICTSAYTEEIVKLENYSFKYSASTEASKETIWQLWTDVENWGQFDERIQYSYLIDTEIFELGSEGVMKGKNAPETAFEVIQIDPEQSFTLKLKLPLYQRIELQRYFSESSTDRTRFTHEVNFRGRLKSIYYLILAGPFKSDLELVVDKIQAIADMSLSSP